DTVQGNWQQLSGKIKQKWGKLTDDDLTRAQGDKQYLVGKLHEQYGIAKDRAEDELQTLGYREDDQDSDLRSSDRSSAGRMDLSGSDAGHTLEAGSQQGSQSNRSGSDNRSNAGKSGSMSDKSSQQKSGSNNPGGGSSGNR